MTPSSTVTPWTFAVRTDESGFNYVGLRGGLTWTAAQAACTALGDGWSLATIADATSRAAIIDGSCFGTLPANSSYWTGLYDTNCCNQRRGNAQDTAYRGWAWASGTPPSFFYANSNTLWAVSPPCPFNVDGLGGYVIFLAADALLHDVAVTTSTAACCQSYAPSVTPTKSVPATASLSLGSSPSDTPSASGVPTASSSGTATPLMQMPAPVSGSTTATGTATAPAQNVAGGGEGGVSSGVIAAAAIGAVAAAALMAALAATFFFSKKAARTRTSRLLSMRWKGGNKVVVVGEPIFVAPK